ncbi:uncharacterized protein LOC133180817 [Saccostrea echinata]|uniref:uncharacterized protein LOC133180817 n=1 Tax=Saccostrea echinata TaxID=191078 RepID=UPI002A7EACF1|nr:uncharacterized protein LOC133180817 [Saccostrea echinata]XP_061171262.1 uncharacterized protein LOC133180817 [Saccostrea echinata]
MGRKKRTSVCQRKKYHYKKRKFTKEDDNCLVKNGPLVEHGYSVPHELKIVEESEKCDPQGGWEYQCSAPSEMIKHETDNCDAQVDWENKNNAPGELEETIKCEPHVVDWEYNVQHELEETMKCEPHVDWYALTTTDFQTNDEPTHTDHEFKHVQLAEPTIEIETALAPLQILYNDLQACEFLKMYYLLDFNDDAINIIEMYRSSPERTGVKLSVVIDTEFHANLFVHRKEVSKSHPCWDGMPSEFSTAMLVENLMRRLRTFSVCFGNPDEEFHSIAPVNCLVKSGVTNHIVAFREGDFCATVGDVSYSSCIRSVNCSLIVESSRCKPCQGVRRMLKSRKSREIERSIKTKDMNFVHSKTSHKIMSRTNLITKIEQQKEEIKLLSSEVERLKKLCNKGRVWSISEKNESILIAHPFCKIAWSNLNSLKK